MTDWSAADTNVVGVDGSRRDLERSEGDSGDLKSRLFGVEQSDRLMKQVIKARLLRGLEQRTGGSETRDQEEFATEPGGPELSVAPVYIDRYAVLRKLGQGGMGIVYAAYDEQLDRKIAIKVLRAELGDDDQGRARMLREAQALARLSHPNVVQVHGVGRWREHDYVAMEFVDGETLDRWLARDHGWRETLEMVAQAGRGLSAAHQAGLVHRDFKPANILVGVDCRARVLDFGLARAVEQLDSGRFPEVAETLEQTVTASGDSSRHRSADSIGVSSAFDRVLTMSGAVMGTPAYMAPEQHLGNAVTALSDQFSFCVVLYEALFGRRPYRAEARAEYAVRVAEGDFIVPGVGSGIPAWLRRAVMRGLSPNPAKRWPSMDVLLAELARDRARSWRRAGGAVGVLALVGMALALPTSRPELPVLCADSGDVSAEIWGSEQHAQLRAAFEATELAGAATAATRATIALDTYGEHLSAARHTLCEAEQVYASVDAVGAGHQSRCLDQRADELRAVVEQLTTADAGVVVNARGTLASLGDIDLCKSAERFDASLPVPRDDAAVETIAELRAELARGFAARDAGRMDVAEGISQGVSRRVKVLGYRPLVGEHALLEGAIAMRRRDREAALAAYSKAAAVAMETHHTRLAAQSWPHIALESADTVDVHSSPMVFDLADAAVAALGGSGRAGAVTEVARALSMIRHDGDPEAALEAMNRAVSLEEAEGIAEGVDLGSWLVWRASIFGLLGQVPQARADLERALGFESISDLSRGRPDILDACFDLGVLEWEEGDFEAAQSHFSSACEGYERTFGSSYPSLVHCRLALAGVTMEKGDLEVAHREIEAVLTGMGPTHADRDWALDALASVQTDEGELDAALSSLRAARAHRAEKGPGTAARIAYFDGRIGDVLFAQHLHDDALKSYDEALRGFELAKLSDSLDALGSRLGRGRVRNAQGRPGLAIESLERVLLHAPIDGSNIKLAAAVRIELAVALNALGADQDRQRRLLDDVIDALQATKGHESMLSRARVLRLL